MQEVRVSVLPIRRTKTSLTVLSLASHKFPQNTICSPFEMATSDMARYANLSLLEAGNLIIEPQPILILGEDRYTPLRAQTKSLGYPS